MRESGGLVALVTGKQNQASKMIEYKTIIYEFVGLENKHLIQEF